MNHLFILILLNHVFFHPFNHLNKVNHLKALIMEVIINYYILKFTILKFYLLIFILDIQDHKDHLYLQLRWSFQYLIQLCFLHFTRLVILLNRLVIQRFLYFLIQCFHRFIIQRFLLFVN